MTGSTFCASGPLPGSLPLPPPGGSSWLLAFAIVPCRHPQLRPGPLTTAPHPLTPQASADGLRLPPGSDEQRSAAPPITPKAVFGPRDLPAAARVTVPARLCRRPWAPSPRLRRPSRQTPGLRAISSFPLHQLPLPCVNVLGQHRLRVHPRPWPASQLRPLFPAVYRASLTRQLLGKASPEHLGQNPAPSPSSLFSTAVLLFPAQTRELQSSRPRGSLRWHWAVPHQSRASGSGLKWGIYE